MNWIDAARSRVTPRRLRELVVGLVNIPSPTGYERPLAEYAAGVLSEAGLRAAVQPLDDLQANAHGVLPGRPARSPADRPENHRDGADLMLYAPVDTLTTGVVALDVPAIGPLLRADMRTEAQVHGDYVTGLGAGNPKGHAACVLAAAEAIAAARVPLAGDLLVGLGAGGMPTNALHLDGDPRAHTGQGAGCSFLLEQGHWADYAVIAKPGWTVSHEEVGLAWFDVLVPGTHVYVGSRHRLPYVNAIEAAGRVVGRLEKWFARYADAHADETVAPQGIVAAVEAGWTRMAAVTPAVCRIRCDLRLSPRTTPMQAKREFAAAVAQIGADLELDLHWEMVLAIPGSRTDPGSPVVTAAVAAWEEAAGHPHQPIAGNSGATDANILRNRGIPTARVGMPKVAAPELPVDPSADFQMGMNTVDVREMKRLTNLLIKLTIDLLGTAG